MTNSLKHLPGLVDLKSLTQNEIELILSTAKKMKTFLRNNQEHKKLDILKGKSLATLFYEASTRTRTSFELAGKYLGADVVNISKATSSITKGENLRDTLHVLERMHFDGIILRSPYSGASVYAQNILTRAKIINAGDGQYQHPSQGLLNLFTLQEKKGRLAGLKVAIIGDVLHSRVVRSDIDGMSKMGIEVHLIGAKTFLPRENFAPNVHLHESLDVLKEIAFDAIEMLRIQSEREKGEPLFPNNREYARLYGLTEETFKHIKTPKDGVVILHPGPKNLGVEISPKVAYGADSLSVIDEQVENGISVRMAILALFFANKDNFDF